MSKVRVSHRKFQIPATTFRRFYDRGDLPVSVKFEGANRKITWKVEVEYLDFHHYLPMFFEGLREIDDPYKFLADKSIDDLLEKCAHKVLPVLPQLILPIKSKFYRSRFKHQTSRSHRSYSQKATEACEMWSFSS